MKIYLAGPMTGIPQFNFPVFDTVAAELRALGHTVVSPPEQDPPGVREAALASPDGKLSAEGLIAGYSWGDILSQDVKEIADGGFDAIVLLEGWERSRGARLEAFVGLLCGLQLLEWTDELEQLTSLTPHDFCDEVRWSFKS